MQIDKNKFKDDEIPYFSYDRKMTVSDIRNALVSENLMQRYQCYAWVMREASFADVWQFVKPKDVWFIFDELKLFLGRKRDFWSYTLRKWHELGKI